VSRNKIKANTAVFEKLRAKAGDRVIPAAPRYISTEPGEEREWLTEGMITNEVRFNAINRILKVQRAQRSCFVLVNVVPPENLPDGLHFMEMNSGLFTAVAADCDIELTALDEYELHEKIFTPQPRDYSGHAWTTVSPFFLPLFALEIERSGPFDTDGSIDQLALWLSVSADGLRTLGFGKRTLDGCVEIALDQRSGVPFLLMANAMMSVRWEHAFLDIYRCIERLLSIPTMVDLKSSLGVSTAAIMLSATLESVLGWRKPEESGLIALLSHTDATCKSLHDQLIEFVPTLHKDYSVPVIGTYIYKLRNSIVHYRPATELPDLSEKAWRLILDFMVESISVIYGKFNRELLSTDARVIAH